MWLQVLLLYICMSNSENSSGREGAFDFAMGQVLYMELVCVLIGGEQKNSMEDRLERAGLTSIL